MPKAYHLVFSRESVADLESICSYIAEDSEANAALMAERLLAAIDGLRELPHRNIVWKGEREDADTVRSLPVRPYIVYFRVMERKRAIEVVTIRHGARQQPSFRSYRSRTRSPNSEQAEPKAICIGRRTTRVSFGQSMPNPFLSAPRFKSSTD